MKIKLHLLLIMFFSAQLKAEQSVELYFGLNNINYNLTSDQFGATQTSKPFPSYAFAYQNKTELGDQLYRFNLDQITQSLNPFSTLSPTNINFSLTRFKFANLSMSEVKLFDNYTMLGWGYSFLNTKADATSPNVLIVNSDIHAVDLIAQHTAFHKHDYELTLNLNLGLPFYKKEYGTISGSNGSTYYLSAGYNLEKQISETWSLLHSAEYFLLKSNYMGSGSRGTANANESLQIYNLLLGVGYGF